MILVNAKYKDDIFATGAILAHEIMHFYLIGKKKIRMGNTLENELLTDLCTVKFGLGLVVINGMSYSNSWFSSVLLLFVGVLRWSSQTLSFGYYNPHQYGNVVNDTYLKAKGLQISDFGGYIKPSARGFLPYSFQDYWKLKNKSNLTRHLEKHRFKGNIIKIVVVIILISCVIWYNNRPWVSFSSATGHFKADFPTQPQFEQNGGFESYTSKNDHGADYTVGFLNDPALNQISDPNAVLKKFQDDLINSDKNYRLIDSGSSYFDNYPAVDYLMKDTSTNEYFKVKSFIANQTIYVLGSDYFTEDINSDTKFINSFQLTQ